MRTSDLGTAQHPNPKYLWPRSQGAPTSPAGSRNGSPRIPPLPAGAPQEPFRTFLHQAAENPGERPGEPRRELGTENLRAGDTGRTRPTGPQRFSGPPGSAPSSAAPGTAQFLRSSRAQIPGDGMSRGWELRR
ncbi:hypothetical protein GCM10027519_13320 [Kineococcus endophyticus]